MLRLILTIFLFILSLNSYADNIKSSSKELTCLAKNIYFESSGEPIKGKIAVAQVTVQRALHKNFPNSICKVIHQSTEINNKKICQFSWNCNPQKKFLKFDSKTYKECQQIAKMVLIDGYRIKHLKSSLYFHSKNINPKWGKKHLATIGNHKFY